MSTHRPHSGDFQWQDVDVLAYKQEGAAPFKDVTRQVLFEDPALACQWRYFEVAPGGHTTLEKHQHVHAVMVIRGRGQALVGEHLHDLAAHDLVTVPPNTWHQFRAPADEPLGFLCLVNAERDRPQLPNDADLAALRTDPAVADFIRA
ncbi:MAG: cupin domain-containing protein [Gammaproteobacteria bacterium]|jgi:quercetin dioxygenase-like cupin family protein|nr:cupin domain-containing protein [Gammaproteobacteria bacterium]